MPLFHFTPGREEGRRAAAAAAAAEAILKRLLWNGRPSHFDWWCSMLGLEAALTGEVIVGRFLDRGTK